MPGPDPPYAPPLVELGDGIVGHLLEWRQHERDGSWHAWVSWIQSTGDPVRHRHKLVEVRAGSVRPVEAPAAYSGVPRTVFGLDGVVRPWTRPGTLRGAQGSGCGQLPGRRERQAGEHGILRSFARPLVLCALRNAQSWGTASPRLWRARCGYPSPDRCPEVARIQSERSPSSARRRPRARP